MIRLERRRHLADGELLRLLDLDGDADGLPRLRRHADTCARCAARLDSLGRDAAKVSAWIAQVDLPAGLRRRHDVRPEVPSAPARLSTRSWMRAAVVLLAVVGLFSAVSPLRARIDLWLAHAWTGLTGRGRTEDQPGPTVRSMTATAGAVLWFTPTGPELRVTLAGRQAAGALVIEPGAGTAASLEITPGDPTVVPLASERVLEIRNAGSARSTYRLRLPASIREVVVSVGTEPPRVLDPGELTRSVRLELSGPRR